MHKHLAHDPRELSASEYLVLWLVTHSNVAAATRPAPPEARDPDDRDERDDDGWDDGWEDEDDEDDEDAVREAIR